MRVRTTTLVRRIVIAIGLIAQSVAVADNSPRIISIDSATQTDALLAKPGTYLGEKFIFEQEHTGDTIAKVGVWESGPGKSNIVNFPFTEYVLMISGSVVVTETDGTSRNFIAGDTFVIPLGWSGTWDVQERMKKQIVRIGKSEQ